MNDRIDNAVRALGKSFRRHCTGEAANAPAVVVATTAAGVGNQVRLLLMYGFVAVMAVRILSTRTKIATMTMAASENSIVHLLRRR